MHNLYGLFVQRFDKRIVNDYFFDCKDIPKNKLLDKFFNTPLSELSHLFYAFEWDSTKEGYMFWHQIAQEINEFKVKMLIRSKTLN